MCNFTGSIVSKRIRAIKMQQKDLLTTIDTMKTGIMLFCVALSIMSIIDPKLLAEKEIIQERISFLSLQLLNKETEKEKLCQVSIVFALTQFTINTRFSSNLTYNN